MDFFSGASAGASAGASVGASVGAGASAGASAGADHTAHNAADTLSIVTTLRSCRPNWPDVVKLQADDIAVGCCT